MMFDRIRFFVTVVVLLSVIVPNPVGAARGSQTAPKLLNLYLDWQIKDSDQAALAKWDLVVLDMDVGWQFPEKIRQLRRDNPNIKIIAYVSAGEIAKARAVGDPTSPGYALAHRVSEANFMHGTNGQRLSWWPGADLMNATNLGPAPAGQRWFDILPAFVHDVLMPTGLWDGVFLDAAYSDVTSFYGNGIDPDGDGHANTSASVNAAWRAGISILLTNMRTAIGPNKLIMNNSSAAYATQVNGALFENFLQYGWAAPMREYLDATAKNVQPTITSFNTNTRNQEASTDYRLMRYGLASTLLGNGYYSFDAGDSGHARTWWYDEYDVSLGAPKAAARRLTGSGSGITPGVWMREYARGVAIVNSETVPRTIPLPGVFEKIRGSQDAHINDGRLIRSLDIGAQDGVLLLGESDVTEVRGGSFLNGGFVRVYAENGVQQRNGFFAQADTAPSGAQTVLADVGANGGSSVVSSFGGLVQILGSSAASFRPFGATYKGKMSLAVGNTNRDAALEIIVGRDQAKPPEVRVLSRTGKELARWMAYQPNFAGGVRVAIGDLDGDGLREIVTGAGPGGGPHIRIFKTDGTTWGGSFFAFSSGERGGVSVAVGDTNGDGKDEIIVGSGAGAIPKVRIFDYRGTLKQEFTLGSQPLLNGLSVTAADVNGDGKKEILVSGISAF